MLEVTTSYLQGKYGVEIRTESVNNDNSHSLVRLPHGLNKLVTDLIDKMYDDDDEQETSTTKTEVFAVASRLPGGWGPQGRSATGGGGLARVPNLRVCKHLCNRGGTRRGEG